jgi:CheY-like chemotaxis protein
MANELILVIEDDVPNRMLVRELLTFSGYRVLEAETAEAGLQIAREEHPALILMDIRLPGMDGVAALAELRRNPATRAIPVMAITASTMTQHRSQIVAAGFDGYHSKPIDITAFVTSVGELLSRSTNTTAG